MTAKEEANALVNKFYGLRAYEVMSQEQRKVAYGIAKQSAIVCIDEIIKRLNEICFNNGLNEFNELDNEFKWFRSIKQQIEKL